MNCQTESIIKQMETFKDNYYNSNGKNMLFKKSQKMDCAKEISERFDLNVAISETIFRIPNTNKFVFNYNVFKLYANPNNYAKIVSTIIELYDEILITYPNFEAHVILESFSISAAERYKEGIKLFCNKCMTSSTKYAYLITHMYIYFTPSMFESISTLLKPFVDKNILNKIVLLSKSESPMLLKTLLEY